MTQRRAAPPPRRPGDGSPDVLEESARLRRSVAETIARVRKLTAGIGASPETREADESRSASPGEAGDHPSPEKDGDDGDRGHGLSDEVSALVDRTRRVIERTRRLIDKTRRESAERKRK